MAVAVTARVRTAELRHRLRDPDTPLLLQEEAAALVPVALRARAPGVLPQAEALPLVAVLLPEGPGLVLPEARSELPRSRARRSPRAQQRPARSSAA